MLARPGRLQPPAPFGAQPLVDRGSTQRWWNRPDWRSRACGFVPTGLGRLPGGERGERLLRQAEQPQRPFDSATEVSGRGGELYGSRQAQQADRHVAQRRHHVRTPCPAHLGTIFVIGPVAHVVQAVLDLPVAASVGEHLRRRRPPWGQARHAVDRVHRGLAALYRVAVQVGGCAPNAEDLSDVRKVEIVVQLDAGPDLPLFQASMAFIDRRVLRGGKRRDRGSRCPAEASAGCPWRRGRSPLPSPRPGSGRSPSA